MLRARSEKRNKNRMPVMRTVAWRSNEDMDIFHVEVTGETRIQTVHAM
jgi:hypothetical protein